MIKYLLLNRILLYFLKILLFVYIYIMIKKDIKNESLKLLIPVIHSTIKAGCKESCDVYRKKICNRNKRNQIKTCTQKLDQHLVDLGCCRIQWVGVWTWIDGKSVGVVEIVFFPPRQVHFTLLQSIQTHLSSYQNTNYITLPVSSTNIILKHFTNITKIVSIKLFYDKNISQQINQVF